MADKKSRKESTMTTVAAAKKNSKQADIEGEVLENIAAMSTSDRKIAEHLHKIIKANAPALAAETLVRHARVRQRRKDRLLLPERAEI